MHNPFDTSTRYLLESHPDAWLGDLGLPAAGPVRVVNADLSTITSEADKVLLIEAPEPWLLHIELQSGRDPTLPRRLLRYNILLDDRHDLPVRSVAVLLRPAADGPELTGAHERRLPGEEVHWTFRYAVARAWKQPLDSVLSGPLGTLPLAPLAEGAESRLPEVIRRLDERFRDEATPGEAAMLCTATFLLMGLRYPRELAVRLFQGVRSMRDSTTYQAILDEGRADEAKQILFELGKDLLGPPSEEAVAAIQAIADADRVKSLVLRAIRASSWDDLLNPTGDRG